MGLREDLLAYLEEEEKRKAGLQPPPATGLSFEEITQALPQESRNAFYDFVGQTLWGVLDEGLFGFPGIAADEYLTEEDEGPFYAPETLPGKVGSAIGRTAGFVLGGPVKLGSKLAGLTGRGIAKAAGKTTLAAAKKQATKDLPKALSKSGITSTTEATATVAESIGARLQGLMGKAKYNKQFHSHSKFREAAAKHIDESVNEAIAKKVISKAEGKAISKIYKKNFNQRPVDDFIDMVTTKIGGRKGFAIGSMIHEATMFGMIDAISEGVHASGGFGMGEGHEYDWTAPLWGIGVGSAFGALKFMAPRGKASVTQHDFVAGLKGVLGKNPWAKANNRKLLELQARWIGKDLERAGLNIRKYTDAKGVEKTIDMANIESYMSTMGDKEATRVLTGILNDVRTEYGKKLMKWSVSNDWASTKENWQRMVAGTIFMNAHTIYDISQGQEIPMEDILTNVAIGAFLNRRGMPRRYDMFPKEMSNARSALSKLGVKQKNFFEQSVGQDLSTEDYINPLRYDEKLRKIVERAENLGISTDRWEDMDAAELGEVSVALSKKDLTLFREFKRFLQGAGSRKYVKLDDSIPEADAVEIQNEIKTLFGEKATLADVRNHFTEVTGLATDKLHNEIVHTAIEIARANNILVNDPSSKEIGILPEFVTIDTGLFEKGSQGNISFITGRDGKVLEGIEAQNVLTNVSSKVEQVFNMLQATRRAGKGRSKSVKGNDPGNTLVISNEAQLLEIMNVIKSREGAINRALGITRPDRQFEFNKLETIADQIALRKFNVEIDRISSIFDKVGNKEYHNQLEKLLVEVGIISEPGPLNKGKILDNISKIQFTGGSEKLQAEAREFLSIVLEIAGAKAQYGQVDSVFKPRKVDLAAVDRLKLYLQEEGMYTELDALRLFKHEITRRINKELAENSNLNEGHLSVIQSLMGQQFTDSQLKPFSFVKYRPIGTGKAPGFSIHKIETQLSDKYARELVEKYNTMVDEMVEASNGIIKLDTPIVINAMNSLLGMDAIVGIGRNQGGKNVRQQIYNFLDLVNGNDNLRDQLYMFANKNPNEAPRMFQWLTSAGIIVKKPAKRKIEKVTEGVELEWNKTRWENEQIREKIRAKLERYSINEESVEQMYHKAEKAMETLIDEKFGRGDHSVLTETEFFNRYVPDSKGSKEQTGWNAETKNKFLQTLIYDTNTGEFKGAKAVDKLIERMEFKSEHAAEARDHAIDIISNRVEGKKIDVIFFDERGIRTREVQENIFHNSFTDFLDKELGLQYFFVDGTTVIWQDRGMVRGPQRTIIDVFERDATILSKSEKDSRNEAYRSFEFLLSEYTHPSGMKQPGLELVPLAGHTKVLAIPKEYHTKVKEGFERLFTQYEPTFDANPNSAEKMRRTKKALDQATDWTPHHTQALRAMIYQKMLTGKDHDVFMEYINADTGSEKLANLEKRISLFFTSSFKKINRDVVRAIEESDNFDPAQRNLAKHYRMNDFGYITWNDKQFADIRERVGAEVWDAVLKGRGSESGFDSITFISEGMADFLATLTGTHNDGARIFKPKISSHGENQYLFAKTVFVHDPGLREFFNNNRGIDMIVTKSADKFAGDKPADQFVNKPIEELLQMRVGHSDATLNTQNFGKKLPLDAVSIGQVPKGESLARVSQSLFQNYMNTGNEAAAVFSTFVANRIDKGMDIVTQAMSGPMYENAIVRKIFNVDGISETANDLMARGDIASQRGLFLDWIGLSQQSSAGPFGDNMITNILKSQYIDPALAPYSYFEVGGKRYDFGAKSVLAQSLTGYRDLAPTIVGKDYKLQQYGEMVAPNHVRNMPIVYPGKDIRVKVINTKTNKLLDAEVWLESVNAGNPKEDIKSLWEYISSSAEPLGTLHDEIKRLHPAGDFQIAMVMSRYPRTRPGDLAILRLREFLDKDWGNATIVNDFDVLNIFEGDYDMDKMDMFWAMNNTTYEHIQRSHRNWIHGLDPKKIEPTRPNIELLGMNPIAEKKAWDAFNANKRIMDGRGIGTVQSTISMVNHLRNVSEFTKDGRYILMRTKDGAEIEVDWDNQSWFERHALEAQSILDHNLGVDKDIINTMTGWRGDYLFPNKGGGEIDPRRSISKEDLLDNTKNPDRDKLDHFLEGKRTGKDTRRIRLFRKWVTQPDGTRKEMNLNDIEVDMITILMNQYNQLLQLAPGRDVYVNGQARRPSYQDYIDRSNEYFNAAGDITSFVFQKLRNMRTPDDRGYKYRYNTEELNKYFGSTTGDGRMQRRKRSASKWKKKEDLTNADFYDWWASSPLSEGMVNKMKERNGLNGELENIAEGSLIERSMYNIWRRNPLESGDKLIMTGDLFARYDNLESLMLHDEAFGLEEIGAILPKLKSDIKIAKSQILRLKYTAARINNNWKIKREIKKAKLKAINEHIKRYEESLKPLLTKEYKKTHKAKDIGDIHMVSIENDREVINATTQYYVLSYLRRLIQPTSYSGYEGAVLEARKKVGEEYDNLNNLAGYDFGYLTILNAGTREARLNRNVDHIEAERDIDSYITDGVRKYGAAFLIDFAMPKQSAVETQVGIFHGRPMPVSVKSNTSYKRAIRWLLKARRGMIDDIRLSPQEHTEATNMLKMISRLDSVWRTYFNGNLRDLPMSDAEWFANMNNMLPDWHWKLNSLFKDYTDFRIGRNVGRDAIFGMGERYGNNILFFRKLLGADAGMKFEEQHKHLSYINQLVMENKYMNPFRYMALMNNLSPAVRAASEGVFPSQVNLKSGDFDPLYAQRFYDDPIYAMAGGTTFTGNNGLTLDPARIATNYERKMMYKMIGQSQAMTSSSRGNRFLDVFARDKTIGRECN